MKKTMRIPAVILLTLPVMGGSHMTAVNASTGDDGNFLLPARTMRFRLLHICRIILKKAKPLPFPLTERDSYADGLCLSP